MPDIKLEKVNPDIRLKEINPDLYARLVEYDRLARLSLAGMILGFCSVAFVLASFAIAYFI